MTDAPSGFDPQQVPAAPIIDPPANFLATTTGKLVVGGVALVVVLAVLGGIAYVFLFNSGSPSSSTSTGGVVLPSGSINTSASASAGASETAPIVDPLEKPLESDFTFRNVFAPTLQEVYPVQIVAPSTTTGGSSTSGSTTSGSSTTSSATVNIPADTLYLASIQTVNGHTTATFIWNKATYVLAPGDSIKDTPWKLISIAESSVVMEFGDTEVTLTLGQGLSK